MTTFTVIITETLQKEVEIEAENEDQAIDAVREQYFNEKIVLDSSDYVDAEFNISCN